MGWIREKRRGREKERGAGSGKRESGTAGPRAHPGEGADPATMFIFPRFHTKNKKGVLAVRICVAFGSDGGSCRTMRRAGRR